jgi:hypothetical protein
MVLERTEIEEYNKFRTGLKFEDVFWMLRVSSEDSKDWHKGITRHTVLGKWREIKLIMWEEAKYQFQLEFKEG